MFKKITAAIIISLIIFTIWYTFPKQHTTTFEGVSYQLGEEDSYENVVIHVDGKLQKSFTGKKTFIGTIEIEGDEMPVPPQERTLELVFEGDNRGIMSYGYVGENAEPKIYSYGLIYINRDFSEFTIAKYEKEDENDWGGNWTGDDGLMITAPATDRETALRISNDLMKGFLQEGQTLK